MSSSVVQTLAPPAPHAGDIAQVRLSPDGKRLAFACTAGGYGGIYVADRDAEEADKLVTCSGWTPAEIAWSPSGAQLAYRVGGKPPGFGETIGWCASDEPGERGRMPGMCFSWAAGKETLYIGDPDELELYGVDTATSERRSLAHFGLHRSPDFSPRIAPSPDGKRLVFTTRDDFEDTARVWCIEWKKDALATRSITWIPGSQVHVHPFWSPKGKSLGLYMVHVEQKKTGLIALPDMQGGGKILYQRNRIDGSTTPAWAPDTATIALFCADEAGLGLELLDCHSGSRERLAEPGALEGQPRFWGDHQLCVDGGAAVHLLDLSGNSA